MHNCISVPGEREERVEGTLLGLRDAFFSALFFLVTVRTELELEAVDLGFFRGSWKTR